MKALSIILGAILLIGGIFCFFTPVQTYSTLSWLIGLAMVVDGVGDIVMWNGRRKLGLADGWTLFGAIVSIVLGVILLGSFVARFAVDLFIAYLIAAWLVIGGITRIMAAFRIREFNRFSGYSSIGSNWVVLLVLGILIVILGVLCFFNPLSVMAGVGVMIGIAIICVGVDLIARGIRMN